MSSNQQRPDEESSTSVFKAEMLAKTGLFKDMHKGMTITSAVLVMAFVLFTSFNNELASAVFGATRSWIELTFGWYYMVTIVFLIAVCVYIVFSRHGSLRLGDDDSRPDFSNFAWFSMLFSAGIGIGILFFGVAEPIFYLDNSGGFGYPNNPYADMAGATALGHERAVDALRVTFFHWGLHGWAVYVIVGMSLAYFAYRKKLPLALRSALYPFIGDRIYGPIGHTVDILGVLGCVFGVATSLGLGVSQMSVGLERLVGIDSGITTQIVLIVLISIISIMSALSGVNRGIKIISQWNIIISLAVIAFFLFAGPTTWLLSIFGEALADYAANFVQMGLWFPEDEGPAKWQNGWTVFYWGWWIAWAPFIGLFIARISRGRTLREFVIGVLLVPTIIIFIWLGIFGGTALYQELHAAGGVGTAGIIDEVMAWNLPAALFASADGIAGTGALGWILSALMVFLLMSWFVTSSDSSTLVLTTILSFGNEEPPKTFRVFWGVMIGFVAAALLITGGLSALQTANMAAALPLSIVIIIMTLGVLKSLIQDSRAVTEIDMTEKEFVPEN
ncbi:BCCT family transporter [Neptunomonas antarctica]|uniref:Choline/glycine/proline betaine transport protein n=1 Tax=Neptunomonas antarctica TaxID=619304 RepID=A0A1N7L6R8_9GAMM|nr:BCCT family transporter [Neptunomonas antarctica]SIS69390.1 choline/glycine/proline betaine transport protein [Neptunomonas antarctica]